MILHGKNLRIIYNGAVLAMSKSCEVSVDNDLIPVSSPSVAGWKCSIPGRSSWSISTNHIVGVDIKPKWQVEVVGSCNPGQGQGDAAPYITINGSRTTAPQSRGLSVKILYLNSGAFVERATLYADTYTGSTACNTLAASIDSTVQTGDLVCIMSYDAYSMNTTLATMISTKLGIPIESIPNVTSARASFSAVGIVGSGGIALSNYIEGSLSHSMLYLDSLAKPITKAPVKDLLTKPGTLFTLQMQVDGLPYDRLSGQANCKSAKISAGMHNVMTGSISFEGTGPLT